MFPIGARFRRLGTTLVVVAAAGLIGPVAALATTTTITSPAGDPVYLQDSEGGTTLTVSGTSDVLSGSLEVRCYSGNSGYTGFVGVITDASGNFTTAPTSLSILDGSYCRLIAVPAGFGGMPFDGANSFSGPRLYVASRTTARVSGGPNNGVPYTYFVTATQITGYGHYSSVGDCGLEHAKSIDSGQSSSGHAIFDCNDALYNADPHTARSEIRVDGTNAYTPDGAWGIGSATRDSPGLPALSYSVSFDDSSNAMILTESDPIVTCADGPSTWPATNASCAHFVSAGVRLDRSISQAANGHLAQITDHWVSTDGRAHALDLLSDEWISSGYGYEFAFAWQHNGYNTHASGDVIPGPSGPDVISVASLAHLGETDYPQGTIAFQTPPSQIVFYNSHAFTMAYQETVPASGALVLDREYAWGTAAEAALTNGQLDAWSAPSVAITTPATGSTVTTRSVLVTGTATDNIGVTELRVNGALVGVAPDGTWQALVTLARGHNTITAVAKDTTGNTTSASSVVTYTPAASGLCVVPNVVGKKLAAAKRSLHAAGCNTGRIQRVFSRKRAGIVLAQAIPAGWQRRSGAAIGLVISKGRRHRH